jgi:uncharacterized protein (UPF0261 family)
MITTSATTPNILVIGTGDTKAEELMFMRAAIEAAGGRAVMMDVSILGNPPFSPEQDKHQVAAAVGKTIADIAASGDENSAMALMAAGAARLARRLEEQGEIDGFIALGGSMGTDLALDVALALPLGVPKLVVSTIAYSHLVPPERIAPDLMMILWAGGLHGLSGICKSVLSQACGAVVGAARAAVKPAGKRPTIGVTSLGSSCLSYMLRLRPELELRGYDVAVFHTTGMGGRAFEQVAAQGGFAAVFDLSLQEITNHLYGVVTTSGADRLENAGRLGIPQIVAPGAIDMIDFAAWRGVPEGFAERPYHAHNRLLASATTGPDGRRATARAIAGKLGAAKGPVAFVLPTGGIQQWDREGEPLHEPDAHEAFLGAMRDSLPGNVELHEITAHINSDDFVAKALEIFDRWVAEGVIPPGLAREGAAA